MMGCGSPTELFAPQRPKPGAAEAYARAEFGDGGAEWLAADAARAKAEAPARPGAVERWLAWASAAASKFADAFL
jgi:hypothetical protein